MSNDKRSLTDRYSYKRWLALFAAMIILGIPAGCGAKENIHENAQEDTQNVELTETEEISGIEYGDIIRVSLTVRENFGVVEELGESEIVVENTSKEFEFPWPDELETDVEEAIGKYVGDSFSMGFEGGDGWYAYEFTILEIVDKEADIVEYGDRIKVSCRRSSFTTECEVKESTYESVELPICSDQLYTSLGEESYKVKTQELFQALLGKQKGDTVLVVQETTDTRTVYSLSVLDVDKHPQGEQD